MENQECAVLLSRTKVTQAFDVLEGKGENQRPKGLAIRVKKPTDGSQRSVEEKKNISFLDLEVIPVWYDEKTLKGDPISLGVTEDDLILLDGNVFPSGHNPVWEFSNSESFDFSFTFFSYDILKVILKRIPESAYSQLLLGCIKMNLGKEEGRVSAIFGDSFVFKLEPYPGTHKGDKGVGFFDNEPVDLGIPLFAIGFGCRHNWKKNESLPATDYIGQSYINFEKVISA